MCLLAAVRKEDTWTLDRHCDISNLKHRQTVLTEECRRLLLLLLEAWVQCAHVNGLLSEGDFKHESPGMLGRAVW
jgi:hypothetical protein